MGSHLKTLLGSAYVDQDWQPAINAIFAAENDTNLAIQEVKRLATIAINTSHLTIHIQHPGGSSGKQPAPQIITVKKDLLKAVEELHRLKGIKDDVPPVNELVEPREEHEAQMEPDKPMHGDAKIVAHVKQLITAENEDVIEISDSKEEGKSDSSAGLSLSEVAQVCEKVEAACWRFGYSDNGLTLLHELRRFHGFLRRMEMKSAKQSTLDSWAKWQDS
ncbi:hypothetical protein F5J12DRAFT_913828 [Pisolithus orientalis]|uniref:uncharacterized protein n=1 Tax=Pisolithus orientalis TaxID=936130 RepID=UPI002224E837|nr:uncharacterized protein F5J12DRAFT_913828 [Pisolithus orientalis]KAI6002582.1 hypothetical protein F5J12DRAFT_913828 [Pisolithus orientalis]